MNAQQPDHAPVHPDHTPHGHPDHSPAHPDHPHHRHHPKGGGAPHQKHHDRQAPAHHKPRDARRHHHRSAAIGEVTHAVIGWRIPVPSDGGWMQ